MTSVAWFALLLAAVLLHRLAEVAISRRRARALPAPVREPGLLPAMVLVHAALVVLPLVEVVLLERPARPSLTLAAGAALVAAEALRVWTLRALGGAFTIRVVVPPVVVTTGPYRLVRHPNYLVVIVELLAIPLLHGAWLSALALSLVNALVLARRIRTEEAALSRAPAWRAAMAGRPRLLPF